MKKYTLTQATTLIAAIINVEDREITSVAYEDGSQRKFIYTVNHGKLEFIHIQRIVNI